jgi:hypothetical protein
MFHSFILSSCIISQPSPTTYFTTPKISIPSLENVEESKRSTEAPNVRFVSSWCSYTQGKQIGWCNFDHGLNHFGRQKKKGKKNLVKQLLGSIGFHRTFRMVRLADNFYLRWSTFKSFQNTWSWCPIIFIDVSNNVTTLTLARDQDKGVTSVRAYK